ncbi:hypothetical protein GWK47_003488 [Chionoecetes opilio]|uniref:Uncharacterized protein n=1 Tax=Chionoecetes opilio TaxID=41210 RepID=A0A8J4YXG7_CHIOP|nr:hypothetical protein GWK47_003488 [Chionoecetes opilio]
MSDASDVGWGYQSSDGRQGFGGWSGVERRLHINVKELLVPLLFLRSNPIPEGTALCFEMDNMVAVHCLARQGTSRSALLLSLSEQIFGLAARFHLHLSARFLPMDDGGGGGMVMMAPSRLADSRPRSGTALPDVCFFFFQF